MKLTTHVLDLVTGRPAAGIRIELLDAGGTVLRDEWTNADGRTDAPLLFGETLPLGEFELRFHVGAYFRETAGFLDVVPVRFHIREAGANYHVPLLCSPWAYSTYRGS